MLRWTTEQKVTLRPMAGEGGRFRRRWQRALSHGGFASGRAGERQRFREALRFVGWPSQKPRRPRRSHRQPLVPRPTHLRRPHLVDARCGSHLPEHLLRDLSAKPAAWPLAAVPMRLRGERFLASCDSSALQTAVPPLGTSRISAWAIKNLLWEEHFLCVKWFPFRRVGELCAGA